MHPPKLVRELDSRFKWLTAFFRSYYCFFAVSPLCIQLDAPYGDLLPFRHLNNVLLYDTVISWCKIFGVDAEDCHWKRVVKDHAHFRAFLFKELGVTQQAFALYQRKVLDFRNKWVVHYDPNYAHDVVPELDIALQSALALHDYLRQTPYEGIDYRGPDSMQDFGKAVAEALISRMHPEF